MLIYWRVIHQNFCQMLTFGASSHHLQFLWRIVGLNAETLRTLGWIPALGLDEVLTHSLTAYIYIYIHICVYIYIYVYIYIHMVFCWPTISLGSWGSFMSNRLASLWPWTRKVQILSDWPLHDWVGWWQPHMTSFFSPVGVGVPIPFHPMYHHFPHCFMMNCALSPWIL